VGVRTGLWRGWSLQRFWLCPFQDSLSLGAEAAIAHPPPVSSNGLSVFRSDIKVKAVVADALYGQAKFMDAAAALFDGVQVISQLCNNQNIHYRNRKQSVSHYFPSYPGVPQGVSIRGQAPTVVTVGSIRVEVCAHGQKRFVIALKICWRTRLSLFSGHRSELTHPRYCPNLHAEMVSRGFHRGLEVL
jgi:hypothetical protein